MSLAPLPMAPIDAAERKELKSYVKKNARGLHALLQREGVPRCPHQAALHAQVSAWLWGQRRRWWCPWYWW